MKKKSEYIYEVYGHGYFPVDMLRYDEASIEDDWEKETFRKGYDGLSKEDREKMKNIRRVIMKGKHPPTIGRWNSFGWGVDYTN